MRYRWFTMLVLTVMATAQLWAQTSTTLSGTASASGTATIGGIGTAVVLTSISIDPSNPAIPFTSAQSFTALGTYSNGSVSDVTSPPTVWSSSNAGIATNAGATFQCVARGTITVSAVNGGVTGTTTLTCQSPTFSPQGIVNVSQGASSITIVQFTGANGSSPYTFSSTDLPGWLSLSNTGCAGAQVNCSLVGTPNTVGTSNFHIKVTDNAGNTAQGPGCVTIGCAVSVNVTASSTEDNIYCTPGEAVTGLSMDGPANPLTGCNNTALANTTITSNGSDGQTVFVCPITQLSSSIAVSGCAGAPQPTGGGPAPACNQPGGAGTPWYCSTIQSALNQVYNTTGCGSWIRIYENSNIPILGTQNVYTEPTVVSPGNLNCGPDYSQPWVWISTRSMSATGQFGGLSSGQRATPGYVGQTSIVGRPNYAQPGLAAVYLPMWRCEQNSSFCNALSSQMQSATVGAVLNGVRIMGIHFAFPHGRNTATDLYGNHVCNNIAPSGTPIYQCSPGNVGSIINLGCNIIQQNKCNITSPSQGRPAALPHGTGSQHVILDRILAGCDDITTLTCYDDMEGMVVLQNGQHMSVIDSYIYEATCIYAVGPCVEAHGISGGNPGMCGINDGPIKIINSFIEASGENAFFGGGTACANTYPTDFEIRRNHLWKPLTWKADSSLFVGQVQDVFISHGGAGYSGATTCAIDPPKSGTTALCTAVVVGGAIADVIVTNKGSGYTVRDKRNGSTYPGLPNVYFTDSGTTYTSCSNQLSGFVNTNGTDVAWVHDNKFVAGLVGTSLTINGVNYTVASFNSNIDLTLTTSAGTQTNVAYASNLPVRGDCVHAMTGIRNVKNMIEFKHGIRALLEGNVMEQNWVGQSDQAGFCMLLTPKNPNNLSPTVTVQDVVFRYNLCRNTSVGAQISAVPATQGNTLPQALARISLHDDIFDGMNAPYWTTGTAPIHTGSGTCMNVEGVNTPAYIPSYITMNHITCIGTLPTGYSLGAGSCLDFFSQMSVVGSPALMPFITFENSICAGGIKNVSSRNSGLALCNNNACSDQVSAHGPSEVALRLATPSDFLSPVSGGTYQKNQIFAIRITEGGTCTSPPTTVTLSGGGGTLATASFNTGAGTSHNAVIKLWVVNPGSGYTSAPTVSFNGTCSVPPTATAYIVGSGNLAHSSACFDHNAMPLAAWNGLIAMSPYSVAQTDPVNNSCDSTTGGHNNTNAAGVPVTVNVWADLKGFINSVNDVDGVHSDVTWVSGNQFPSFLTIGSQLTVNGVNFPVFSIDSLTSMKVTGLTGTLTNVPYHSNLSPLGFANFMYDSNFAEQPTGDLHLQSSSPFHLGANDGLDIGANVDLVLGKSDGSAPSQYTGCTINAGVTICPQ